MIKPREIHRKADALKVSDKQVEKDYVITWVLFGVSENKILRDALAFKGGTVLKKAYFDDYRYSEDLDFTLLEETLTNDTIVSEFQKLLQWVTEETDMEFQITKEKLHKESGSLKFFFDYVAPLDGRMGSRDIKVDVTRNEQLEFELQNCSIFTNYSDIENENFHIKCYSLSEVVIEKMTAIMGRTIPRDVYDLWYLLEMEGMDIDDHFIEFESKAKNKGHDPQEFRFKLDNKVKKYDSAWSNSLNSQIHDLPPFDQVLRELNQHLRKRY
ncbi:nucleotidyl transferase AbiEii/AbiGii toxin family protein [Fulvivirgaceae bacterium BMA10]|uniref:Nucleotidyl transferase AbiEii/AbiGii toxin family protein n=1 Tax=Splendidivirga corallicola TaxID=3051826 RepID=A0ABT8KKH7_9BACT|nr:nucleotidyl transferase AbiEii/AbiGii toxin family protein [Fulvivirgaceae bacterium BMA10]